MEKAERDSENATVDGWDWRERWGQRKVKGRKIRRSIKM